jgi:hypothetical protein
MFFFFASLVNVRFLHQFKNRKRCNNFDLKITGAMATFERIYYSLRPLTDNTCEIENKLGLVCINLTETLNEKQVYVLLIKCLSVMYRVST